MRRSRRRPGTARSLAKLTRPRLEGAYARERLFGLLDRRRDAPIVWVAGPPGSGKTTVVATWVEERELPAIWYQLDAGDSDVATFFYYLKQAAIAAGVPEKATLPLLTPAYRDDIAGFAQRWFRELFSHLPDGALLALDNYQEVAADSLLHRALAAACTEVPPGAQLLVMSWVEPPADFSRQLSQERLKRIDGAALRLTADEARGIAAGTDALTREQIRDLHQQCGGWAAGFTLLRERTRRTGLVNSIDQGATMQEVFDYFMAQVFRDAAADSRETLIKAAVLPRFTESMAVELSGSLRAGELFESLCRRHLFVERRYGSEITYQYHALFRAFLLDQARRYYTPLGMAELRQRAAALLETAGAPEDAVELLLEAGDPDRATRLLESLAPGLAKAGRGMALQEWLARVPDAARDSRPALSYWLGVALTGVNVRDARAAYERAYAGFVRDADRSGQAMAVGGVLQTYLLEVEDLAPIQRWLAVLEPLFAEQPSFPSDDIAARVYGTLVGVMLWIAPAHPFFRACVRVCIERLEALLAQPLDDDVKVTAAGQLAEYYGMSGHVREADRIIAAIEPLARRPSVSPLARAFWWIRSYRRDYVVGDFGSVHAKLRQALAIVLEAAKLDHLQRGLSRILGALADLALDTGELESVPPIIARLQEASPGLGRQASGRLSYMRAKLAASRGDLPEALRNAEMACSVAADGVTLARFIYQGFLASVLMESGDIERARATLERTRGLYSPELFPLNAFRLEAAFAVLEAAPCDARRRDSLQRSLRRLDGLGVELLLSTQPLLARRVAELLIRERIELPYVRRWIRCLKLPPPSSDLPGWPWAIRIRTLGGFRVELDDAPLTFSRKAPRKPLELLQAIVAFGGRSVPSETLGGALWPDADGDAAEMALRATVSRLRKLLLQDAVVVRDGKLSLDDRLCWVDLWAAEKLVATGGAALPSEQVAARLSELYRGDFLAGERERPWMLERRKALRERFAARAGCAA